MTEKANIGVVGLAVMGSNLARNLASREGNRVAIYNRSIERTTLLVGEHPEANFIASETIDDFVNSLAKPRTAIIMVQAGAGTDAVINQLAERFEPGDIIVDGGNALFTDTIRREKEISAKGINFVGAGISGGEEGVTTINNDVTRLKPLGELVNHCIGSGASLNHDECGSWLCQRVHKIINGF